MSDITTTPDMLPITPPTMAPIGMWIASVAVVVFRR